MIEEITVVEKTEAAPAPAAPAEGADAAAAPAESMDTTPDGTPTPAPDAAAAPAAAPATNGEPKKKVKKTDLSVVPHTPSLPKHLLHTHKELETSMIQSDKLIVDTEYAKNSLEEYVYDARGKLEDRWADFVTDDVKEKFMKALNDNEEWLYTEEGEDATKSQYKERLEALKLIGDPIAHRHRESEVLPSAVDKLKESINAFLGQINAGDDKLSHISAEDLGRCKEEAERKKTWLEEKLGKQSARKKTEDPVVTAAEVDREREVRTERSASDVLRFFRVSSFLTSAFPSTFFLGPHILRPPDSFQAQTRPETRDAQTGRQRRRKEGRRRLCRGRKEGRVCREQRRGREEGRDGH